MMMMMMRPSASVEVELREARVRLEPLGVTMAALAKLADPMPPSGVRLAASSPTPSETMSIGRGGGGHVGVAGSPVAQLKVIAVVERSRVECVMRRKDGGRPYSLVVGAGELEVQANGDEGGAAGGGGGRGRVMVLAASVRLKAVEAMLQAVKGDEAKVAEQVVLLETCSAYASLVNMKPSQDDPLTGEVSGLHVRLSHRSVGLLASTDVPQALSRRERDQRQVRSEGGGARGAVKIHMQNFTARLGAGFGGRYGETCVEMVRGVVEMRRGAPGRLTVEVGAASREGRASCGERPCVAARYLEWAGGEADVYPTGGQQQQRWGGLERLPACDPSVDHLFFCLHSLAVDATSAGTGRQAGEADLHASAYNLFRTHHSQGQGGGGGVGAWGETDWGSGDEEWPSEEEASGGRSSVFDSQRSPSSRLPPPPIPPPLLLHPPLLPCLPLLPSLPLLSTKV